MAVRSVVTKIASEAILEDPVTCRLRNDFAPREPLEPERRHGGVGTNRKQKKTGKSWSFSISRSKMVSKLGSGCQAERNSMQFAVSTFQGVKSSRRMKACQQCRTLSGQKEKEIQLTVNVEEPGIFQRRVRQNGVIRAARKDFAIVFDQGRVMSGAAGRVRQAGNLFRHMGQLLGSQPPGHDGRWTGAGRFARDLNSFAGRKGAPQAGDANTERPNCGQSEESEKRKRLLDARVDPIGAAPENHPSCRNGVQWEICTLMTSINCASST